VLKALTDPTPPSTTEAQTEPNNRSDISLMDFIKEAWPILEPRTDFQKGEHLELIAEHLQAVTKGEIRNLLINVPPRHMKSLMVCVFWPVWEWINKPERRYLFSSYALPLAIRDSVRCRRLIESDWFRSKWGSKFKLTADQNTKHRFDNDRGGCRLSVSVGGSATGEGGDRVIVDDPHNVTERESELARQAVIDWWDQTMSTRLNDPKTAARIIVMQRVHDDDLSAHVLAQNKQYPEGHENRYVHLRLPAEFDPSQRCQTKWGTDERTTEHPLLWPERFGKGELGDFKLRLGPSGYAGQFQQTPVPASGARFQREWFRYYELVDTIDETVTEELKQFTSIYRLYEPDGTFETLEAHSCNRFAIMDPAGTEPNQHNRPCYTVIQVWDVAQNGRMMLVHQYRRQVQTPDVVQAAKDILKKYAANFIGVEKAGIGLGIAQTLKKDGATVQAIVTRGSKDARSEIAEIRMAAGLIYFPRKALWLFDLEHECLHFPRGTWCDQVDAMAHAAIHVQKARGAPKATEPQKPEQDTTPQPNDPSKDNDEIRMTNDESNSNTE
jgi:predicted phage terminase large subunit-like protein